MTYGNGQFVRDEEGIWRYALTGTPVPGSKDVKRKGQVVAMFAPELLPDRLLSARQAAALAGRTVGSWRNAMWRGFAPAPVGRIEDAAFWTEGVIREWMALQEQRRQARASVA